MFVLSLCTALIWGITNWFLKRGSTGLRTIQYDNRLQQFGAEIWYFFTQPQVNIVCRSIHRLSSSIDVVLDSISDQSEWLDSLLLQPLQDK